MTFTRIDQRCPRCRVAVNARELCLTVIVRGTPFCWHARCLLSRGGMS